MKLTDFAHYTLSSYDAPTVLLPEFFAGDKDVAAKMQSIAARHASTQPKKAHPVNADDIVNIDITTTEDGHEFGGLTNAGVDVQLGIGTLPSQIETALLGANVGDTITVEFDWGQSACADQENGDTCGSSGATAHIGHLVSTIKILGLRETVVPQITDEWVQQNIALSKTVEEFRAACAKKLVEQKQRDFLADLPQKITALIGQRLSEQPPHDIVEQVGEQLRSEFERFLEEYDLDVSAYLHTQGLTSQQFDQQLAADARERVTQDIALIVYAKHHNIQVDDDDINAIFLQPTPEKTLEARKQADQTGETKQLHDLTLRAKAAEAATRSAIFTDASGKVDDSFSALVNQMYDKQAAVRRHTASEPMRVQLG